MSKDTVSVPLRNENPKVNIVTEIAYNRNHNTVVIPTLLTVETEHAREVSDGYHTFEELYRHRNFLFLALAQRFPNAWYSSKNADGSEYEGWFVVGVTLPTGEQITYHMPVSLWDTCNNIGFEWRERAEWDGHDSDEVIKRIVEHLYAELIRVKEGENNNGEKDGDRPGDDTEQCDK